MKKIIMFILMTVAFNFAIEVPSADVIALADYLDSHPYKTRLYGETSCKISSTFDFFGDLYLSSFVQITVSCYDNHSMAYRLPKKIGKLEKHKTHNDVYGSYAEYYYYPEKYK